MNTPKILVATAFLLSAFSVGATTEIEKINEEVTRIGQEATSDYAIKNNKDMPKLKDYSYGMDMDVNKMIHISKVVRYCGNVKKIMSFEDSKGEIQMIRYSAVGTCLNDR